ncbi:MAG: peptidylprolyl isomerase [Candidatus Raymondbacteria bacterium RifOxyA12_full_50_37]|uniref:Peptidyl-prolyl cis-trans isomerase n=1 Tax=Candidatus Raymondbacteria bacterium RIFOXYD12_FULL_49_13 TaxID=1817890 RepID=A0A1F7FKC1_UNCRA|nr:MAG: peptidylprolyl isomerase [Candidatus Raymondbacteria bacterium RifOxyA12_full_50_37]OGJ90189.1 MAG: peptidylprolyl isomerase [Candidatus Raymondbacteria bacterium RIFOXYA2_FULL_49_16]OGJ97261.1 MAG: peptidylprolyl isomerase [Candidatus Raymondbacteria bacterium RIFOXYC2_FULL_50_21]OGJ98846.1 MAG: peptidylprolyl isomerase [Candidatus Raymondbacteria bacterium RifOxyB12_full_50_8]OGK07159.1 MAG: peptidylprolyl isomerase [Candidatus Raymondbacteria bacterium RIFOXYD12_FULL_49_13]OGP43091.
MDIGTQLRDVQSNIDFDAFVQGIRDTLEGKKTLLTPEQAMAIKTEFFQKMQAEKSQKNTSEGDLFLAENKKKPGIIITPSGLQYIILTAGKGPKPVATDKVVVHYSGTLIDGTEFDSSYKRGQPATFVLNQVIPGWTEAIQLMNVGAKYRFFIPSQLAYGERGAGPRIGPNATLIFEVELINIEK